MMPCRSTQKKDDEPIQYVPGEEKKTVIESPERKVPKKGKEGGDPEQRVHGQR